ncbi:MAG: hypothetical protein NTV06_06960 [candidate division Zixibacteria bacterium]|nr:hypothetical protein [candidate division Zixibacteria bacterium]
MAKLYLIIFVAIILVASCAKDIFVEPPAVTLRGLYQGRYMYHQGTVKEKYEKISCKFTDQIIRCSVWVGFSEPKEFETKDFQGNYKLENKVILTNLTYMNLAGNTSLMESTSLPQSNDTLRLLKDNEEDSIFLTNITRVGEDNIIKELRLHKIE